MTVLRNGTPTLGKSYTEVHLGGVEDLMDHTTTSLSWDRAIVWSNDW